MNRAAWSMIALAWWLVSAQMIGGQRLTMLFGPFSTEKECEAARSYVDGDCRRLP
jgi:hypothetical protein